VLVKTYFYFVSFLAVTISIQSHDIMAEENAIDLNKVYITGGADQRLTKPGSATLIDSLALEKFEYTDINRVLNAVPGVNIQEEDGYGLRPNIGLRGTSPERSKKITIMEDGILTGPAPYSAPAAYYFPNISRMSAVEVFKGPSTIQYGPATIGGAINLLSRTMPYNSEGELDVQYGSDNFQRINIYQGQQVENFGYLVEVLRVSADGFKELDNSGDTGFVKNDFNLKTSWQVMGEVNHQFQLKIGYADEISDETYLGLTLDDFNMTPKRRYVASSLDLSEWVHQQYQFTHKAELSLADYSTGTVTTDVYHNKFDRDWFKVNGFNSSTVSIDDVLKSPSLYQSDYNVLTGSVASSNIEEQLAIGNNAREYVSEGIQSKVNMPIDFGAVGNEVEVGVRLHRDNVKRHHTEQNYSMLNNGELVPIEGSFKTTTTNSDEATAVAVYIQNEMQIDDTKITFGMRHEEIKTTKIVYGNLSGIKELEQLLKQSITLPGVGIYNQVSKSLGVLAGVYQGFTAATAGNGNVEPEQSTNYEIGLRYTEHGPLEVIGFLNDYSQFSGTCSFSQGNCDTSNTGEQTNAGSAFVYGIEASWSNEAVVADIKIPLALTYTYSYGEFAEEFTDATGVFGEQGQVIEAGYQIAYLPEHRLNLQAGMQFDRWDVNVSMLYQSDMRNTPGENNIDATDKVPAYTVFDLSAKYRLAANCQLYMAMDNALGKQYIVAAKPYGYRPGKPRSINLGVKYQF
jgi:Fe(3+) dicitrate transport protein